MPDRPEVPARAAGRLLASTAAAVAVVLSWRAAAPHVLDARSLRAAAAFARSLFPPDLSPAFLAVVGAACVRTLALALSGTLLSVALGIPLALLAGSPLRTLAGAGRFVLRALRAVPELVWALLFVVAFGLGPLPGALALGVSYAGVVGRVAADLFASVPRRPVEALQSAGASRLQAFAFGIWPQAAASLASYIVYSFECCVRSATVVGFVGAGGLGHEILLSLRMFEYGQALTLLAALCLLLLALEGLGTRWRRRWQRSAPLPGFGRPGQHRGAWGLVPAAAVAFWLSGAADLASAGVPGRVGRFVARLFPPVLDPAFLRSLVEPLLQTVAVSIVGTTIGVAIGIALGLPSTRTLMMQAPGEPRRPVRAVIRALASTLLAILRAIPELVWVLLCIIAVGLGPGAGALALGLHTGGVLGRLYAETLEEVPPGPVEALRTAGASRLQALLVAAWPLARPTLTSYTMLRWETNLRVSTVVGLVGGGGLGMALYNDVQLGFLDRAMTIVAGIYLLVVVTDRLADRLRPRVSRLDTLRSELA